MIQSDGVLMGCSTYGQIAGVLTKGIAFFTMNCGGERTPIQYKLIPLMAIAEGGVKWVPIAGSWRDPAIYSGRILTKAIEKVLEERFTG